MSSIDRYGQTKKNFGNHQPEGRKAVISALCVGGGVENTMHLLFVCPEYSEIACELLKETLTLIKGACQPLPNEGHVGDFSSTETALLEKRPKSHKRMKLPKFRNQPQNRLVNRNIFLLHNKYKIIAFS